MKDPVVAADGYSYDRRAIEVGGSSAAGHSLCLLCLESADLLALQILASGNAG